MTTIILLKMDQLYSSLALKNRVRQNPCYLDLKAVRAYREWRHATRRVSYVQYVGTVCRHRQEQTTLYLSTTDNARLQLFPQRARNYETDWSRGRDLLNINSEICLSKFSTPHAERWNNSFLKQNFSIHWHYSIIPSPLDKIRREALSGHVSSLPSNYAIAA